MQVTLHRGSYYSFIILLFVGITRLSIHLTSLLVFFSAPSLPYCSLAGVRCFIGCLLRRWSIMGSAFSPVPSFLPLPASGESLECSFFFFCHSSVAWFRGSSYCMRCMHVCEHRHTHPAADSPGCLIFPFSCHFSFCTQNSRKPFHTAAQACS